MTTIGAFVSVNTVTLCSISFEGDIAGPAIARKSAICINAVRIDVAVVKKRIRALVNIITCFSSSRKTRGTSTVITADCIRAGCQRITLVRSAAALVIVAA
jgi:hypothetical protein